MNIVTKSIKKARGTACKTTAKRVLKGKNLAHRKSRRANKHAIQAGKYDQAPRRSHMFTDRDIS